MVKIAICGAGIAGLSTYLLLQKHLNDSSSASASSAHEITIYEAYDVGKPTSRQIHDNRSTDESTPTPQSIGSGIGISKNGLNVLSRMERTGDQSGSSSTGLDSGLIKEMARRGHPIERWEISTARGWTIVDVNLVPRHLRDPSTQRNGRKSSTSVPKEKPYMYHSVMITRKACWEILRDRVLEQWPEAVVKKRVVEVSIGDAVTPNVIKFDDGTEETVDLIIGADGLRSVVRKAMFENDNSTAQAKDDDGNLGGKSQRGWAQTVLRWFGISRTSINTSKPARPDYITPHYEGLVGVGGLVPSSLLELTGHKPGTMSIVFGPNGFFGYGYLTSAATAASERSEAEENDPTLNRTPIPATTPPGPIAGWWSTFSSSTAYPYNDTGSTTPPSAHKPGIFNRPLAMRALLARHAQWKNPTIAAITSYVEACNSTTLRVDASSMGQCDYQIEAPASAPPADANPPPTAALDGSYPTWTTPELPHWTVRGRVALVGDAAHALQPSSGQGACQALEDAEALALLLRHHLDLVAADEVSALTKALQQYEALRMPRVHAIYERSQRMSRMKMEMGVVMEWTMYLMIYIMTWFRDTYNDVLFEYDLPADVERVIREAAGK